MTTPELGDTETLEMVGLVLRIVPLAVEVVVLWPSVLLMMQSRLPLTIAIDGLSVIALLVPMVLPFIVQVYVIDVLSPSGSLEVPVQETVSVVLGCVFDSVGPVCTGARFPSVLDTLSLTEP